MLTNPGGGETALLGGGEPGPRRLFNSVLTTPGGGEGVDWSLSSVFSASGG